MNLEKIGKVDQRISRLNNTSNLDDDIELNATNYDDDWKENNKEEDFKESFNIKSSEKTKKYDNNNNNNNLIQRNCVI